MRTRLMLPIGLAALLLLGLCTALASQAVSNTDYTLATADGLALSFSAGGQVASVQIDGTELVSAPGSALLLRDLSQAGAVTQPNLIGNPGFEQSMTGWTEASNSGLNVSVVVSPAHGDGHALELSNPLTATYRFAAYASDPVPVTPGQRYRVSAWWRSATGYVTRPAGPPPLWQMRLWQEMQRTNALYVQWLDASGRPLGDAQLAVPLHWNTGQWRLTRRELTAPPGAAQVRVVIGALLSGETIWVDDVAFVPAPEPDISLTGTVEPCPQSLISNIQYPISSLQHPDGCLSQTISLPEAGLTITLTYTAHTDHIAVHGEVVDTTGQDRALDVTWGVPLDTSSAKTWWDDAHTSRPITDTRTYGNAISAIYDGWLPISLYPYAGISTSNTAPISNLQSPVSNLQPSLALGLPLDRPQLALLAYDGASGRYGATFHLGISPQAVKVGPRAGFDLMLYRFDPAWGFRDVIARHRALQPDAYTTDIPMYDYTDASQGQYYTQSGVQQALAEDATNTYSAQYTVGEFHLRLMPDTEPRPTLDQALAVLTDTLSSPQTHLAARAQAIVQSAVVDTNGDWSIKKLGSFPWSEGMWEMVWAGNADPDLEDGLASYLLDWRVTPAFTATIQAGAHLDGVQIDNFMSNPTFDLRPEAIGAADWPLGYTPHTYQPAVHTGFAFREYLAFLRDYLDTNWGADRGITINFWGLGHPNYLAAYLDAFGSEGNLDGNGEGENWNPEILNYRRAIAYPRVYRFANQTSGLTATEAYTFSQLALLYGVRTGHGPNGDNWEPEAEQVISDTIELIERYWAAGWEPVTYARADGEDVWIERFGALTSTPRPEGHPPPPLPNLGEGEGGRGGGGEGLYFPIHNRSEVTRTATITVETVPLGLTDPASAVIADIAITQTIPFSVVGGDIVVELTLGPRQTRVLQVSGGVAPPTPTPTATPTATPTPPASQCVGDVNANGIGDVVDIQTTAADLGCHVYLPLVVANWHQPWPTPTPTPGPTPTASLALTVAAGSDLGDLSHLTGGHINLNGLDQSAGALSDLQDLLGLQGRPSTGSGRRLVRIHYALRWWADEPEERSRMTDRVAWVLEQGGLPLLDLFAFPPSWTGCPDARGSDLCKGYPPQDLAHFRQQVTDLVRQVYLPALAAHPDVPRIYELLNEPDLPQFWNGTRGQYLDTLTALKDGILAADPQARFAGPAAVGLTTTIQGETTAVSQDFIDWFLDTGLALDRLVYFTLHAYSSNIEVRLLRNLPALRQVLDDSGLATTGIVMDEWNFRIGETALDTVTDAAFVGRRLAYYADLPLAGHTFFKLQDSEEDLPRHPFSARLGAVNPHGLRKPVFHALRLGAMLGETRLAVIQTGDWTERSVLAGRDTTGTVSVLIASGGEVTGTLPTALLDLVVTDLTAARYDVEVYRVDAGHANAYALKDEITAAYQSTWNEHLEPVRQALLDAGYLPDVADSLIAGLQTDPVATLEQLKEDNPALYADTVAALDAEKPFLDADLEALAAQYNADPRVDLIPETISLTPVDGRASLEVALPAEGVLLVHLGAETDTLAGAPGVSEVAIQPDPVYTDDYPVGAGAYADPDGDFESGSTFRWLVNGAAVLSGTIPQTLLAHFDDDLATTDGELPAQATNLTHTPGRWDQALLFTQSATPLLAYDTTGNFDNSEGTLEFWVELRYDLDDPHYDIFNSFFLCRIDPQNALYVEANGDRIIGVVQREGNYYALWPEVPPGWRAGEWHHVAMTWSAAANQSRLYYDGVRVAGGGFIPPPGTADRCYVGSDPWGNRQAEAVIDELRLSGRALSDAEIYASAHRTGPPRNGEVPLPPGYFDLGDRLVFEYTPCDGDACGAPVQSPPVVVAPVPLGALLPAYEHLPSGTITFTLSLTTSVPADCRWGSASTPYAQLPYPFDSGQGTISHTTAITGLTDLATLSVYVRCADRGATGRSPDDYERDRRYRVLGPFNSGYPRIVKLWGSYDPDKGPDFYARHDLIITNNLTPAELAYLHDRNPHLKVLYTLPGTYGRPLDREWETAQPGAPTYPCLLRDSQGQILYVSFWDHPMFNMTNRGCVDRIVDFTRSVFDAVGYDFDGLFYDRLHDAIRWLGPDIDADLDGQPDDPDALDEAYRAGVSYFLARLRALYPHIVIAGNDAAHLYNPWANGREYEWQIGTILDLHPKWLPWVSVVADYRQWSGNGPYPQVTFMLSTPSRAMRDKFGVQVWERIPPAMAADAAARYDHMRFGLASALMGDGLYGFDFGDTWHGTDWWYDEWGTATLPKGYLGLPLGQPQRVREGLPTDVKLQAGNLDVWRRDFQGGIALVNATGQAQTIELERAYRRLRGAQAPLAYVIVDDDEPAFSASSGWASATASDADFGFTVHSIPAGTGSETATWTPTITHAGHYTVSVWYRDVPTRTLAASYTVNHAGGSTPVSLDFTGAITGWVPLGVFPFDAGDGGSITLTDAAPSGYFIADALRLDSVARFNDGAIAQEVTLDPWDGIILRNCPAADVTGDGVVNVLDLQSIAVHRGLSSSDPGYVGLFDLNGDGVVSAADLAAAASQWHHPCE